MKNATFFLCLMWIFFFVLPGQLLAGNMNILSVKDAVEQAIDLHPSVKAEDMAFQAKKEALKGSESALYPSIDLTGDAGYEWAHNSTSRNRYETGLDSIDYRGLWYNTASLSVTQLLYDGSLTKNRIEIDKHKFEAGENRVKETADQIAIQTIESYLDVLKNRKIIQLAERNISLLNALKDKTQMRLESGKGTVTDVVRVQLTLSDVKALLVNYQGVLRFAEDRFTALTRMRPEQLSQPDINANNLFDTSDDAIDHAVLNNKALLVARATVAQRLANLKASRALYHPKVNFIINAAREENIDSVKDVDNSIAGLVRVNFNLFKGGGDTAAIQENTHLLSEAKFREEEILMNIKTRVRYEFNNIVTSGKQLPLLNHKVEQNQKILSNYHEQFLVGKRDILDVIEAQKMLLTFQAAVEDIKTQNILSGFKLLQLTSLLFDTLGVEFEPSN